MSEMIERVGNVIENELDKLADVKNYGGFTKEFAIAAIKAMREPTEEMFRVGFAMTATAQSGTIDIEEVWQAMIDKALEE